MSDPQTEFARQWLKKAENDVITARQTLALEDGPTDTPCFHAQQAVEKSLKALLTANGIVFPYTHDVIALLDMSIITDSIATNQEIFNAMFVEQLQELFEVVW